MENRRMGLKVCVFCGSKPGADPAHGEAAQAFGRGLAERGMTLVYGGGRVGMMGLLSDAALDAGAPVIGVIPEFLMQWEVGNLNCTQLIETDSMHSRKQRMAELSDVFVTFPGGMGTLDETVEIITWKQLRLHAKPVILFSPGGYWDPFEDLMRATVAAGFTGRNSLDLYETVSTFDDLWDRLGGL
jgi:uncharacterized protein (TIGR00730 family)